MRCPRCQQDQPDGLEECRACGVIFSRYRPWPEAPAEAERGWLASRLLPDPGEPTQGAVILRALLLLVLAIWWLRLLFVPIQGEALLGSVLHWIHLPFHEAGHVVFAPFGEFLHILGGTLGQLLVPILVLGAFLSQEDAFGAAVAAWWLGQSFMDCAPYIDDARAGVLMLTTGMCGQEDRAGHDWFMILFKTGLLRHDHDLARLSWLLGVLVMLAALGWAAWVVCRQVRAAGLWNVSKRLD
jgi:hypothetical protein